ncbi:MAG: ATP-binding protein [Chloroflexota bacterium]
MNQLFSQILNLISQPPGNLIYHLVLVFAVLATFQAVSLVRRPENSTIIKRLLWGLSALLMGQILLFALSALSWQNLIEATPILPLFDRFIVAVSLLIIAWMWTDAQPRRGWDIAFLAGIFVASILFFSSLAIYPALPTSPGFNQSPLDMGWSLITLLIVAIAVLLFFVKRSGNWETGLAFFIVILIGVLVHLLNSDNYSAIPAALRLAQLCAFPILPSLASTILTAPFKTPPPAPTQEEPQIPIRRSAPNSRAIFSWLRLAAADEQDRIIAAFTQAVGKTLSADLTFLVSQENPYRPVVFEFGYDFIRDETLSAISIDNNQLPLIGNALQRNKALRLTADSEPISPDLTALTHALGLTAPGNILMIPAKGLGQGMRAVLVFSPYSGHLWNVDEQSLLTNILEEAVNLWQRIQTEGAEKVIENLENQLARTKTEVNALRQEIDELRKTAPATALLSIENTGQTLEITGLLALQRQAQDTINRLDDENRSLRAALQDLKTEPFSSTEVNQFEKELRQSLEETARLQNALAAANMRIIELQTRPNQSTAISGKDTEAVMFIIQELRHPISSIIGYTDLLMNESVGSLGLQQRKFLESIKASSDRIQVLLDDLLKTSIFNFSPIELVPQPVDIETVLDQVIVDMADTLREKRINLLMDVPADLPTFYADRDALHQVIIHLLQNAGSATPPEGSINLKVKLEQSEKSEVFVHLLITDEGGGIPSEELNRVFLRRFHAENPPIQGIGDSGVGLLIAKTLVEAHGGRIWVESEAGKTSTFSVLLPVQRPGFNGKNKSS